VCTLVCEPRVRAGARQAGKGGRRRGGGGEGKEESGRGFGEMREVSPLNAPLSRIDARVLWWCRRHSAVMVTKKIGIIASTDSRLGRPFCSH
jgi:hypothetical protein